MRLTQYTAPLFGHQKQQQQQQQLKQLKQNKTKQTNKQTKKKKNLESKHYFLWIAALSPWSKSEPIWSS